MLNATYVSALIVLALGGGHDTLAHKAQHICPSIYRHDFE